MRRVWKSLNIDLFHLDLSMSPLCNNILISDVDTMMDRYNSTIICLLDVHAPVKQFTFRERKSYQWFDDDCHDAKVKMRGLERRYKRTFDSVDRNVWEV